MPQPQHIYPVFDQLLQRAHKEQLLQQRGITLWFTGLSGAGKTTIAQALEQALYQNGIITQVLDGDNLRTGLNNNLGFTEADRTENIRRVAEVAKLFTHCGIVVIACFISPTHAIRQQAKQIIGATDFKEIFIDAPLAICEERDVKGLYKKARAGLIKDFTGIDAIFEPPQHPDLTLDTTQFTITQNVTQALQFLLPVIRIETPS